MVTDKTSSVDYEIDWDIIDTPVLIKTVDHVPGAESIAHTKLRVREIAALERIADALEALAAPPDRDDQ